MLPSLRTATARVTPEETWLDGGLDLISPPGFAKRGTCRFGLNYELEFGGGYSRIGGYERFSGLPKPHLAEYVVLECADGITGAGVGALVVGSTSAAEGIVIWLSDDLTQIAMTAVTDGFTFVEETLTIAASPIGIVTNPSPVIDSFLDNDLAWLAAEYYRTPIQKPPGNGPIHGVAIIDNKIFAWRDDGAAKKIYKATVTGWVLVDLGYRVSFTGGGTEYFDGGTLVQGGVGATIRRVVLTNGEWGGTAEGYFVIDAPVGGSFAAGGATGTGTSTLTGAHTPIQLLAGGRVETVVYNFTGSISTTRLYGCDGVNAEFEFDGAIYVPIETGMGNVRASHVYAHKNHLFYAYGASLQHSGIGTPFIWVPLLGAGELTTGDEITNLVNVSGSEANAALMVTCIDTVWVLYGSDSESWKFVKVSNEAGAQAASAQNMGRPIVFDRDGFNQYNPTQEFGNFSYESASRAVDPLVRNGSVTASVLVKNRSKYRCFFSDGSVMTGTPIKGGIGWMMSDYERIINVAVCGEVGGVYRTLMGDTDGWVLEADVGRSFDGATITAGLRLSSMNQRSSVVEKQYRHVETQVEAGSAFALALGAEYSDSNAENAGVTSTSMLDFKKQYGAGLFWDFNSWDRAYWDGAAVSRPRYAIHGKGRSLSLLFSSASDRELPHIIKTTVVLFTLRRLGR